MCAKYVVQVEYVVLFNAELRGGPNAANVESERESTGYLL